MIEKYLKINPKDLDRKSSSYDLEAHLAYPTLEFIEKETGINLIIECGTEELALLRIRRFTKDAMHTLKASKDSNAGAILEFLIAKDEEYREAFLELVACFIEDYYTEDFNACGFKADSNPLDFLPARCIIRVKATVLGVTSYDFTLESIRSDY